MDDYCMYTYRLGLGGLCVSCSTARPYMGSCGQGSLGRVFGVLLFATSRRGTQCSSPRPVWCPLSSLGTRLFVTGDE